MSDAAVQAAATAFLAEFAGTQRLLDPVAEHRTWSPWLELTSGDTAPAWMRLVSLLLPPPAMPAAKGRSTAAALSSVIAML